MTAREAQQTANNYHEDVEKLARIIQTIRITAKNGGYIEVINNGEYSDEVIRKLQSVGYSVRMFNKKLIVEWGEDDLNK